MQQRPSYVTLLLRSAFNFGLRVFDKSGTDVFWLSGKCAMP